MHDGPDYTSSDSLYALASSGRLLLFFCAGFLIMLDRQFGMGHVGGWLLIPALGALFGNVWLFRNRKPSSDDWLAVVFAPIYSFIYSPDS